MKRVLSVCLTVMISVTTVFWSDRVFATDDIQRGKSLFQSKNCSACHSINGRGGGMGPALDDVGSRRDRPWLTQTLEDPALLYKGKLAEDWPPMPKLILSKDELSALVTYLLTLKIK